MKPYSEMTRQELLEQKAALKAEYNEYQKQRLSVTPGLTCYWQIQPQRNNLSFDQWMELDLKYIRERSYLVDWKIILRTFGVVLSGQGE